MYGGLNGVERGHKREAVDLQGQWKSWSGNRSLKREKSNQRIQEFLKCKAVLYLLTSYIWNHVFQNHGGTHTLQHLESKPFLLLRPRKWWYNICVQMQKQIQHVPCILSQFLTFKIYLIFKNLNRFIPGGFYFGMLFLHFNMLDLLNINITKLWSFRINYIDDYSYRIIILSLQWN